MHGLLKPIVFFILLLSFRSLFGSTTSDSLKAVLNTVSDHERLPVLQQLTTSLAAEDNNEALTYAQMGLKLAKAQNDTSLTYFYDQLGEIYRNLGEFEKAIASLKNGLAVKKKANDTRKMAISYNKLGKVYANTGEYEFSVNNFLEALKIMERLNDEEGQSYYLNNIGIVYDLQKMYAKALEYYEASLVLKEKLNNDAGIAATTNNMAIVYFNLNNYRKSLEFHKRALELNIKLDRKQAIGRSYNNIGFALIFLNQNEEALEYLFRALEIRREMQENTGIATTLNNIGRAYLNSGKLKKAEQYCLESLDLAKSIQSNDHLKNAYLLLSDIYERLQNSQKSLEYFRMYSQVKDSILTLENAEALAEAEAKYQNEKKELALQRQNMLIEKQLHEIELESSRRKLFLALFIGVGLVLVFALLGYFQKRRINLLLKAQNLLIENKNAVLDKALQDKSELLDKVFTEKREQELPEELLSLSQREMEVLSYLALGWTDSEIAEKLFVSKATIKTHLRRIYSKLLVKGRAEAVSIAHRHNIIGGI
ncbi:MAG: tetratricopeptide repeat protein [Flavobacteriales bacterium]|nr:tetratricopeptide repeat protein [Flavobacteriales bacterium]